MIDWNTHAAALMVQLSETPDALDRAKLLSRALNNAYEMGKRVTMREQTLQTALWLRQKGCPDGADLLELATQQGRPPELRVVR